MATAGKIVINLTAGTSQFIQDLEKAKGKVSEFGGSTKKMSAEIKESNATLGLLGETMGIHLPRHVRNFLSSIEGVAPALATAFSAFAVVAIGEAIVETGKKIFEFAEKVKEAAEKSREAFRAFHDSLELTNDELELTKARLEQDIAALEGKPKNNLEIGLIAAKVAAEHLAEALDKDLDRFAKLMAESKLPWYEPFTSGSSNPSKLIIPGTDEADKRAIGLKKDLSSDAGNPAAQAHDLETELQKVGDDIISTINERSNGSLKSLVTDFEPRLKRLQDYAKAYQAEINRINTGIQVTKLGEHKGDLEDDKANKQKALEAHKKQVEALKKADEDGLAADAETYTKASPGELIKYWQSRLKAEEGFKEREEWISLELVKLHKASDEAVTKLAAHGAEVGKEQLKKAQERAKVLDDIEEGALALNPRIGFGGTDETEQKAKLADIEATRTANAAEAYAQLQKLTAERAYNLQIGHTNAQQIAFAKALAELDAEAMKAKEARLQTDLDEAKILGDQLKIATAQAALDKQAATDVNARYEAQTKIYELQKQQSILYKSVSSGVDAVSDNLSKAMTGQKTSWASSLQGVAEGVSKNATKDLLDKLIFGGGKKADGSENSPWWVKLATGSKGTITSSEYNDDGSITNKVTGASGGLAGLFTKLFNKGGSTPSDYDDEGVAIPGTGSDGSGGGLLSTVGKGAVSIFSLLAKNLPKFAAGGDIMPNQSVIVGDGGNGSGSEIFTPSTAGRITPGSAFGSTVNYNVDARQSEIGAEARIHRSIQAAHNAAVSNSLIASDQHKQRTPQRKP